MNEPGDDAAERRKRADELHEEIDRLKSGEPNDPDEPMSPREFTDPGRRRQHDGEDDQGEEDDSQ